ncbi:hypothetical protein [Nitrospira japonica]|nr:hypothetical protein [Nitrospira japonica]
MIRWTAPENPQATVQITLYAGNPAMQETIPERGALQFRMTEAGKWEATHEFSGTELGRGTFLTVVTQRPQGAEREASGEDETILDWRAFRLLTKSEQQRKEQGVRPGGEGSVMIAPALLQASSGHGTLPPARGGDKRAWWSLADLEGNTSDVDLDGDASGIPGLTLQVSTPWPSSATEDWKQSIRQHISGVAGHQVRFGELEWWEKPDRRITLGKSKQPIDLRHYYTVITLFTNATVKSFNDKEIGGNHWFIDPTYFAHETSARLKHTEDPRFWASYSRREHSTDPRLLHMLYRQVARDGTVPGLGLVQRDDGDGGPVIYTAGFYATVRPWESTTTTKRRATAGFVGLDVVAARAGIGGLVITGSAGASALEPIWCQVIRCGTSAKGLDLDKPPEGYEATQAVASLATLSGELPMIAENPELAERFTPSEDASSQAEAPADDVLAALPARVRFGVSANLRSGALLQRGSWGYIQNLVPINAYAQFVVKLTVAMIPEAQLVTSDEPIMPMPVEMTNSITVPPPPKAWWSWPTEHPLLLLAGAGLLLTGILIFVPGGIPLLRSIMKVVTQVLQLAVDVINHFIKKVAALVHKKLEG